MSRTAPWTRNRPVIISQPAHHEPVIGHAVLPREAVVYRYPQAAEGPAERMERLAASGYPGARTPDEESLVQTWVLTGMAEGHRRG